MDDVEKSGGLCIHEKNCTTTRTNLAKNSGVPLASLNALQAKRRANPSPAAFEGLQKRFDERQVVSFADIKGFFQTGRCFTADSPDKAKNGYLAYVSDDRGPAFPEKLVSLEIMFNENGFPADLYDNFTDLGGLVNGTKEYLRNEIRLKTVGIASLTPLSLTRLVRTW